MIAPDYDTEPDEFDIERSNELYVAVYWRILGLVIECIHGDDLFGAGTGGPIYRRIMMNLDMTTDKMMTR